MGRETPLTTGEGSNDGKPKGTGGLAGLDNKMNNLEDVLKEISVQIGELKTVGAANQQEIRALTSINQYLIDILENRIAVTQADVAKISSAMDNFKDTIALTREDVSVIGSALEQFKKDITAGEARATKESCSVVEALQSERAVGIINKLEQQNMLGGGTLRRFTVIGTVCSVVGIALSVIWRRQDKIAKMMDARAARQNEDVQWMRHEEVITNEEVIIDQQDTIIAHQLKPWWEWNWFRREVEKRIPKSRFEKEMKVISNVENESEYIEWSQLGKMFDQGNLFE